MWHNEWGGNIYYNHGESNAPGVCILFKPRTQFEIKKILQSKTGRAIMIKILYNDTEVVLANIYAPNCDSPEFFNSIFEMIELMNCENIILGGDFNLAMDIDQDKKGVQYNNNLSLEMLKQKC